MKHPLRNYIGTPEGVSISDLYLSGEFFVAIGFKKLKTEDIEAHPLKEDIYEFYGDLPDAYVVEFESTLHVVNRRGNDWFSYAGTLEEVMKGEQ